MASACREARGSATCTTLAGLNIKMEIYPVTSGTVISPADPINTIVNPSAIVIYPDADVDEKKAAKIRITKFAPSGLAITDDDDRVEWSITPAGSAKFFKGTKPDATKGAQVMVYGVIPGEILIEADYGWTNKAQFRAVVVDLKQIKFRVNRILTGALAPKFSVADIKKHIRIANIYLRQIGIKMVPDDSPEVASSASNLKVGTALTDKRVVSVTQMEQGFFDVVVNHDDMTKTLADFVAQKKAIRVNAMNEIFNIAYVHSLNNPPAAGGDLAIAILNPVNHGQLGRSDPPVAAAIKGTHRFSDHGTPSSSWIAPNGLPHGSISSPPPRRDLAGGKCTGTPAKNVRMLLLDPDHSTAWESTIGPPERKIALLWGLIVDGRTHTDQSVGNSLAHEIGHMLGLRHRIGNGNDTLPWPRRENLMHGSEPPPRCQHLDLVQCLAVRSSEVLFRPHAIDTSAEVEP
jgi:hypothetical protein